MKKRRISTCADARLGSAEDKSSEVRLNIIVKDDGQIAGRNIGLGHKGTLPFEGRQNSMLDKYSRFLQGNGPHQSKHSYPIDKENQVNAQ